LIVAEQKPFEEIRQMIATYGRVLILGCGTCMTVCDAGGEREVSFLHSALRLAQVKSGDGTHTFSEYTLKRQCDPEYIDLVKDIVDDYDAIIFVGGPGATEYFDNPIALNIARQAAYRGKVLAAICIAPAVLANAGVLGGIRATSFWSERDRLQNAGAIYTGAPVERDGLIITASDPRAARQFGRAIAQTLTGRQ